MLMYVLTKMSKKRFPLAKQERVLSSGCFFYYARRNMIDHTKVRLTIIFSTKRTITGVFKYKFD